jgi:signal transduction histidine kinase
LQTGEPILENNVDSAWLRKVSQNQDHYQIAQELHPRSIVIMPLIVRGRVIGALTVARTTPGRPYDDDDLSCIQELAGRTALALENARLFRTSTEAARLRDEVLRIVAHDLRNPLNSILLSAQMLRENKQHMDRDNALNMLEVIIRSVERANRLIQDLLDVARMEAGQLSLKRDAVDTAQLVREAVELQSGSADKKSITLAAQLPERLDWIDADHDRILQVLSNLMDNATKFTAAGGRITVRAEPQGESIRFGVTDTGPGIAPDDMPHLFDRFWQAQKGGEGSGLGLGIARGIVEEHGGRIWADSKVGQGSTFYFTVPVYSAAEQRSAAD